MQANSKNETKNTLKAVEEIRNLAQLLLDKAAKIEADLQTAPRRKTPSISLADKRRAQFKKAY